MARPLRIQYPGAWYHVTSRGNEKAAIFKVDEDRLKFLSLLGEKSKELNVEVHCYCMKKNHFHLILRTPLANLNRFMQRFNTAYIMYFNKKHDRVGHLYQGRYKAILVDADSYLMELSRYVHLNPVRGERFKDISLEEKIEILERYPWSSYHAYSRGEEVSFLHTEMILGMIGGKGRDRFNRYRQFVLNGLTETSESPLKEQKARSVLGSESFVEWVYREHVKGKEDEKEYSKIHELAPLVTIEDIAREVAAVFRLKKEELFKKRSRIVGRQVLMELSRHYMSPRLSLREIADELGVSVAALHQSRERLQNLLRNDKAISRKLDAVRGALSHR